jgi:hypothetical protein
MPEIPEQQTPTPKGKADTTAYNSVADAFYRKEIGAPAAARINSQNAYTIAAAAAAALVAAGAFGNLESKPLSVQIFGALALFAWLLTAALFMYAIAAPSQRIDSAKTRVHSELEFMNEALKKANAETDGINNRQALARLAAGGASIATLVAISLALFLSPSSTRGITVDLSAGDRARLTALCDQPVPAVMDGTANAGALADGTVEFDPDQGQCETPGSVTLQEEKTVYILAPDP